MYCEHFGVSHVCVPLIVFEGRHDTYKRGGPF